VKLSLNWLVYSHPLLSGFVRIFTSKVCQTDLVFGLWSEFVSRSTHARLQISVCSSYDLWHSG